MLTYKKIKWSNLKMIIVNYWPLTDHLILLDVSIQQLTFLISIFGGEKKILTRKAKKVVVGHRAKKNEAEN